MLRSSSKYTGDQVFPGTEGLAQTNSIYPFLDNLTAGGHASSSHGQLSCERPTLYRLVPLSITLFQHSRPKNQNIEGSRHHCHCFTHTQHKKSEM